MGWKEQLNEYVNKLVSSSAENKFAVWYDDFQKLTNGIEP
jgi:hypothetical protein